MVSYIEGGQVFVNGKLITSNGYEPKDGDIISVRGKGRFILTVFLTRQKRTLQCAYYALCINFVIKGEQENGRTKITCKTGRRFPLSYLFKNDFQDLAGAIREEGLENRKICIVTDSHVAPLYHEAVKSALQEISSEIFSFVFEAGEKNKT